ncbi:MAG: SDR family oxidoreductase, partial [Alphaproteobacteria bacterium]|nr:SDR family oxidoreductase [Alphaproteobacteria bacterium]
RTILVTGAGGGLGGAMALALAQAGHQVAACDVSQSALAGLRDRAQSQGLAARIECFDVDLGDEQACAALAPRVAEKCGNLFMVVNNAGVGMQEIDPDYSTANAIPFWDAPVSGWQKIMDVNVRAPLILAQQAAKLFVKQGRGRIVNVTTSFDTMLAPKVWAYGQAKASLEAASASLAAQLASTGVTMNILVPGGPANTGLLPANTDLPRDKILQPAVMGPPVVWLASDDADGFNGRRIVARFWGAGLPGREAAMKASAPSAWPGFGAQAAQPK